MSAFENYIKFLQEYKKLLERGVKDIFTKNNSPNYIWLHDLDRLQDAGLSTSSFQELFKTNAKFPSELLSIKKPFIPEVEIPNEFWDKIEFDEATNTFKSIKSEEDLIAFKDSVVGKSLINEISVFKKNRDVYSKFFRAYNDIANDSNIEVVLSTGLVQYSTQGSGRGLKKINQHLFHFPLRVELDRNNNLRLAFSDTDKPYCDFFFLNKDVPIEKSRLSNVIDRFEQAVEERGSSFLYEDSFKDLIERGLQQISDRTIFKNSIEKPESDHSQENYLNISFSPSINIKRKKPRFFEKLTESILEYKEANEINPELFNLIIRDPNIGHTNHYPKKNYFISELFERFKDENSNLNGDEDFSAFFPLPYNREQKQIYDNYLKNRLTVVAGPPGTGKSHTIVNILCSLLAQGKRVLVTAQTDKALESLLDKIPSDFDDLIFTKIQLENDRERFSLESSIHNISSILTKNSHSEINNQIVELNRLKGEYVAIKSEISAVLEKEYEVISLNESFKNLRSYQLRDKLLEKDEKDWNWIKDPLCGKTRENIENYVVHLQKYLSLQDIENSQFQQDADIIKEIGESIAKMDFRSFLSHKTGIDRIITELQVKNNNKYWLLTLDLDHIGNFVRNYNSSDIVLKDFLSIKELSLETSRLNVTGEDISANLPYSQLIKNSHTYINDISTYLAQLKPDQEKIGGWDRLFNSRYKQIKHLEEIVLNRRHCDNRTTLEKFETYLKELRATSAQIDKLKIPGFITYVDEDSSLFSKKQLVNQSIEKFQKNYSYLKEINNPKSHVLKFAEIFNIDPLNVESIFQKVISERERIESLRKYEKERVEMATELDSISYKLKSSNLSNVFSSYIPLSSISDLDIFLQFRRLFDQIIADVEKQKVLKESKTYLKKELPNTFESCRDLSTSIITKENFEFAQVEQYLTSNNIIDLHQKKEVLTQINEKIFQVKSKILFDLARDNFKKSFEEEEIDRFINLLNEFEANLRQANRAGIKDRIKYQLLARKNSIGISEKLSCWVMKFNDVLDSVGEKPEVFDCIIVDEASQLDFNSLILGYYAKNLIVVGDDKQTSPSSLTGADGESFDAIKNQYLEYLGDNKVQIRSDNSLFTLAGMVAGRANSSLVEHFRCVPEIIEFSKAQYYNGSLRPLKQINAERLVPLKPILVHQAYVANQVVEQEISAIKELLKEIFTDSSYSNKTIGVVSLGTARHTEKLKDIKEDLTMSFGKDFLDERKLIIEDAPKFQGDERDVMIISLGVALDYEKIQANENPKPRSVVNSLDDHQKINVALSRAKEQMILVHSVTHENLRDQDFRREIISFFYDDKPKMEAFDLPDNVSPRNRNNVPAPFDSWFEYDVASDLKENEYHYLQPQYKVKEDEQFFNIRENKMTYVNFKLDLVVYNNGKMVAIECDGDPFHSLPEDVAYDTERQEFLERVGWKVYRILYSSYKRDPHHEIQKMIEFIKRNTKKDYQKEKKILNSINSSGRDSIVDSKEEKDDHTINGRGTKLVSQVKIKDFQENRNEEVNNGKVNKTGYKHVSLIDRMEEEVENLNPSEELPFGDTTEDDTLINGKGSINIENNLVGTDQNILYFNLFSSGKFSINKSKIRNAEYSLGVTDEFHHGELLMFYDNGKINKVQVQGFIKKQLDKIFTLGKCRDQTLIKLELVKSKSIVGICYTIGDEKFFKAHNTSRLKPNNKDLKLQGKKIIYDHFESIKYKTLPLKVENDLGSLLMKSFQSSGKSIRNNRYRKEWDLLKSLWPEIFNSSH